MFRKALPITFILLLSLVLTVSFSPIPLIEVQAKEIEKPLVTVIVDSSIYAAIESSLNQYAIDVENAGYAVNITETNQLLNNTPEGIRTYLQEALNYNLTGAVLVGDIPEAWYEVGDRKFPTDMYYMDLNGLWTDMDNNGIYDARGGDLLPEIWIGRIKVSTLGGDGVELITKYFDRNHRYRNGFLTVPWWRALLYIDDQGIQHVQDAKTSMSRVATDVTLVTDPKLTNATDYKGRLRDALGYQWLYLMSHGLVSNHTFLVPSKDRGGFEQGGTVYASDYRLIDPRVSFYHFFTCSAARYTDLNYLAGTVVFESSYGLLAIGATDNTYTFSFNDFYRALSEGASIGTAFKQWLSRAIEKYKFRLVSELNYQILFHATTLIGDPTLQLVRENHDITVTDLVVSTRNVSNQESLFIILTVENQGEFTETFELIVFYDSEVIFSLYITLKSGENITVTFSPKESFQYIWGTHSMHVIEAKVNNIPGEFDITDNAQFVYFEGKVLENPSPAYLSPIFFALAVNGIVATVVVGVFRMLVSDRPLLFVYLRKARSFIKRKIFDFAEYAIVSLHLWMTCLCL